jgi:hypothetical protein
MELASHGERPGVPTGPKALLPPCKASRQMQRAQSKSSVLPSEEELRAELNRERSS